MEVEQVISEFMSDHPKLSESECDLIAMMLDVAADHGQVMSLEQAFAVYVMLVQGAFCEPVVH
jgi:hypothetical protein